MSQTPAPRLVDPGPDGWAQEPKVSQAELLLYAELAGVVRLLGQSAVAAADAYSLTCKHTELPSPPNGDAFARELVQVTWQLYENARAVHREVAEKATARVREFQPFKVGADGVAVSALAT